MPDHRTESRRLAPSPARTDWYGAAILLTVAASLTLAHLHFIAIPRADARFELHTSIVEGSAESPYRYRVLIPYTAHAAASVLERAAIAGYRNAVGVFSEALTFFGLAGGLVVFYFYLRRWFGAEAALAGALFAASMTAFAFTHVLYQPWGWWELAVFTGGLWLAQENRRWSLLALIAAATLMRETACLVAVLYVLTRWREESPGRVLAWGGLLGGVSLILLAGLRLALGWAPHVGAGRYENPLTFRLVHNFTTPMPALTLILFFGVLWMLALKDRRRKPPVLRRALWFMPIFLALYLAAAHMEEPRYYFAVTPIIVPLAFMSLFAYRLPGEALTGADSAQTA